MAEMFPLRYKRNVTSATWQKWAPVLRRKFYLDRMAETLSWCLQRNVVLAAYGERSPRVAKKM